MRRIFMLIFRAANACVFLQLHANQTSGQLNTITTSVPLLSINTNARAGGLGDAGCASSSDVNSNYWNASKNIFAEKGNGISFSYTPWLRELVPDIHLAEISMYKKIGKKNALGLSGRYFSLGEITFTDSIGSPIRQVHPYEYTYSISYSRLLTSRFSVGISARKIYSDLTGGNITLGGENVFPAKSIAGDISCFWKDTIIIQGKISEFAWGINIFNIGQKIKYTDSTQGGFIPANLRIGASYKINMDELNTLELIFDANKLLVPTPPYYDSLGNIIAGMNPDRTVFNALYTSFYDAPGGYKEEMREVILASGIEYRYKKMFAVRTGYFYEHATKGGRKYFTLGAGVRYSILEIDFSYLIPTKQGNPLENTWRVTLSCEFDTHKNPK